ncbi:hypothetical protein RUM44_005599 [Polyplax serrata]|uniref:Uncharacterized protein n=1 Tax=Polyplax serrata TaxID=468196 RepID=A0ABR1ADU6_POLSC
MSRKLRIQKDRMIKLKKQKQGQVRLAQGLRARPLGSSCPGREHVANSRLLNAGSSGGHHTKIETSFWRFADSSAAQAPSLSQENGALPPGGEMLGQGDEEARIGVDKGDKETLIDFPILNLHLVFFFRDKLPKCSTISSKGD